MKKIIKLSIVCLSLAIFSSLTTASSSDYPDSIDLVTDLPVTIDHDKEPVIDENPLVNIQYGAWSSWETSSHMTNCTAWTPDTDTVNWGEPMIQTQICDAQEKRSREVTKTYTDGTVVVTTEEEYAYTQVDDEQDAVGTKNYVLHQSTRYSSWVNSGGRYSCSSWSPSESSVETGTRFTQTRTCKQDQTRTKTVVDVWADGSETKVSETTERKTTSVSESRSATGTKPITYPATGYCPSGWSFSAYSYRCFRDDAYYPEIPGDCPSGWEVTPAGRCALYMEASFKCDKGGVLKGTTCYIY